MTSAMDLNSAGGDGDFDEPHISSPIRQLPFKKVPVHIGDYSVDVSVHLDRRYTLIPRETGANFNAPVVCPTAQCFPARSR